MILVALVIAGVWLALRLTAGETSAPEPAATTAPAAPPAAVPTDGAFEVTLASDDRACDPQKVRITPSVPADQRSGSVRADQPGHQHDPERTVHAATV